MEINCIDLKDLIKRTSFPSGNNGNVDNAGNTNTANITENILVNFAVDKMFNIHLKASKTAWNKKMFESELARDGSGFIISYLNNKDDGDLKEFSLKSQIAGFLIFYNASDEIHILDIAVTPEMQMKGIGTYLVDYVINKYSVAGIKYFFLEVRVSNLKAIRLYKKFGFRVFMRRKGYYDNNKEDALCMVKEIEDMQANADG